MCTETSRKRLLRMLTVSRVVGCEKSCSLQPRLDYSTAVPWTCVFDLHLYTSSHAIARTRTLRIKRIKRIKLHPMLHWTLHFVSRKVETFSGIATEYIPSICFLDKIPCLKVHLKTCILGNQDACANAFLFLALSVLLVFCWKMCFLKRQSAESAESQKVIQRQNSRARIQK